MITPRNIPNLLLYAGSAIALIALSSLSSCRQVPSLARELAVPFVDVQTQVAHGATVYASHCASCHGASGQGKERAPALIGSGAFGDFDDALQVAGFVTENMPPKAHDRSVLTGRDYWAVLAFALSANGVSLTEPAGPANAGAIKLGG